MDGSTESVLGASTTDVARRTREFAAAWSALPPPGHGQTLERYRLFYETARESLSVVKLLEAHCDARAILAECNASLTVKPDQLWGVWAANPPHQRLELHHSNGRTTVSGTKPWCSGAHSVQHALLTCYDAGGDWLAAVDLRARGIAIQPSTWANAGMRDADTCAIVFDATPVTLIGAAGSYIHRPGFWQGAVGIAACWLGGAAGVADCLRVATRKREDPHLFAHLGAIDAQLTGALAFLRGAAMQIDAKPLDDCQALALELRAVAEQCVASVIERTGRALGAAPLCINEAHAQRVADLSVFVRQSHAEHDLEALGRLVAPREPAWLL